MSSNPYEAGQPQPGHPPAGYPSSGPAGGHPLPGLGGPGQDDPGQGGLGQGSFGQAGLGAPAQEGSVGGDTGPMGQGYTPPGYAQAGYPGPALPPPPGYPGPALPPPPGYPGPALPPPGAAAASGNPILIAAGVAVPIILLISLVVPEGGSSAFGNVTGWSIVAMICAVLVAVGSFLTGPIGRQLRFVGAGGVVLFWVLISLPVIAKNTALGVTLAAVAALYVAWPREEKPS